MPNNTELIIKVCGPRDDPLLGTLKLSVASHAPAINPPGWKDLWKLSPFSHVAGGVQVPGLPGVRSKTIENAWQFLKVWDGSEGWDRETALAAFDSDCAMRFPRGRNQIAVGHFWGETGELLNYVEARKRIYLAAYCELLAQPDRRDMLDRLRKAAETHGITIWDYDSYVPEQAGLTDMAATLHHTARPFAHAFIVALAVAGRLDDLEVTDVPLI